MTSVVMRTNRGDGDAEALLGENGAGSSVSAFTVCTPFASSRRLPALTCDMSAGPCAALPHARQQDESAG